MGTTISVLKTLIVPAVISLILFLLSTYVIIPFWRRYHNRYSQYLPIETISSQTTSLRQRIQNGIAGLMVPSAWRRNAHDRLVIATDGSEEDFGSEDGEELDEVSDDRRRVLSGDSRHERPDDDRRLSRDLEEGFRDDSDDEDDRAGSRR